MVNLAEAAIEARELSYSPYSHFQAGATLLCDDGHIVVGANIEIAGSTVSCCAMRVALTSAISSGYHKFVGAAMTSEREGTDLTICGACRQMLGEFCDADMPVVVVGEKGSVKTLPVGKLMPYWEILQSDISLAHYNHCYEIGDSKIPIKLIEMAELGRTNSIAPFSQYHVGAALLSSSGKVFTGGNIEQTSRSLTICAERVALFKAIMAGERDFLAIAIVGGPKWRSAESNNYGNPCAVCRQALNEFNDGAMSVYMAKGNGDFIEKRLIELLPYPFNNSFYQ